MRTNIHTLFDEFKLHATDDYVFRGFSGRIRQLVIQGVDTPTKAAWVAEFVQELTARMRKCEYTVSLRPEPWFPKVPSHIRFGIYVVINQGVIPVDDLDQSDLTEWHALEGRQFATAAAFLALSSDRPADPVQSFATKSPAPQSSAADCSAPESSATQSSAPQVTESPRTSVGKLLCWNHRSVTCFLGSFDMIRRINTGCLTQSVKLAWVHNDKFVPLATIGTNMSIVHDIYTSKMGKKEDVIMCIAGTLEPALCAQLPPHMFDLYEHTVLHGDELVNNTGDDIVVCESGDRLVAAGVFRSYFYRVVTPGSTVCSLMWGKEKTVVCSEPVLQFAK